MLLSVCSFVQAQTPAKPGEGITLRPTASSYQEEIFSADIASLGLEELGYDIAEITLMDYTLQLTGIANNALDFTGIHYEKLQEDLFEASGGTDKLQRVGQLYELRYGYLIDKPTAEEYGIQTIDQLQAPDLAKVFDSDGDGKANLVGCEVGWNCHEVINHHLDIYGLTETVEQDAGSYSVLMADMITRHQQGEPVLYYFYTPYWVHSLLEWDQDVVVLAVPYTDLPSEQSTLGDTDTTLNGVNYGWPIDFGTFVVSQDFVKTHPAAVRFLEQIHLSVTDINTISQRVNDGEDDREDVKRMAEEWVESNRAIFDQWLAEAREAGS